MIVDEDGSGIKSEENGFEPSYRMVMRRYHCYICQKEYNEMVNALTQITCQKCGEGFVEIVEKNKRKLDSSMSSEVDEEKRRANE